MNILGIVNSKYFSWYREYLLKNLYKYIEEHGMYCCHYRSFFFSYILWLCWKDLKEVKENLDSKYIKEDVKQEELFDCHHVWFHTTKGRLAFLQECIDKIKNIKKQKMYSIELVWNREFNWRSYGDTYENSEEAIRDAIALVNSGDGARVKKARVIEIETGKSVWNG